MFSLIIRNGMFITVQRYSKLDLALCIAKSTDADEVVVALCDKRALYHSVKSMQRL